MSVLLVQRPSDMLVELLDGGVGLLGDVAHNGMHHLRLVVPFFALDNILGRDTAFAKIDVAFVLVHPENDHDFVASDADELLDTSDTTSREFGEENHAIDVV